MSVPKGHHYLPEFYLKGFCTTGDLWVYDRKSDESRKLRPETVAKRKNFYSVEGPNGEKDHAEVERRLGVVENQAAPVIRKLDTGGKLELREQYALAIFVALLKFRTTAFERQMEEFHSSLANPEEAKSLLAPSVEAVRVQLKQLGYEGPQLLEQAQAVYDHIHEEGVQHQPGPNARLEAMLSNAHQIGREFMLKPWTVAWAPEDYPFITSDLPLAVVASKDARHWSLFEGLGVLSPGYEAWIPLSRRTLLIIGKEAFIGRYIRIEKSMVHNTNIMVAAQCERFFMAGDEQSLMRTVRVLSGEITNGWTLPGSLDLSGRLDRG